MGNARESQRCSQPLNLRQGDLPLPFDQVLARYVGWKSCFQYPHQVDYVKTTIGGLPKKLTKAHNVSMEKTPAPYIAIGNRLAAIRRAFSDDSQKSWAERHGFNPTQYNNWEKGTRRITVDCSEKLADTYGLSLDFIYRGKRDGLSENARKAL